MLNEFVEYYINEKSQVIIIETDLKDRIISYNKGLANILGQTKLHVGDDLSDHFMLSRHHHEASYEDVEMMYLLNENIKFMLKGCAHTESNKKVFLLERDTYTDVSLLEQMSDINLELSNLSREVTKKNRDLEVKNNQITALMLEDPLTKLNNRRFLYKQFNHLLNLYHKNIINHLTLAVIDLDKFKHINDQYGHDMGDVVLKMLSKLILKRTRDDDLKIRFGGDEFVIVFVNMPLEATMERLELIRREWNESQIEDTEIRPSISIGIVEYDGKETFQEFVKRGDNALYTAKEGGRNRIVVGDKNVR